jgi:hypothetical protein
VNIHKKRLNVTDGRETPPRQLLLASKEKVVDECVVMKVCLEVKSKRRKSMMENVLELGP